MKICVSADWHINKDNRLDDMEKTLTELVAGVKKISPQWFVFNGDAYKNWRPTPLEMNIFHKAILEIADSGIKVFIVVGNHDYPESEDYRGAHCFTEVSTLTRGYPNRDITVVDTPLFVGGDDSSFDAVFIPHIPKSKRSGSYAETFDVILKEYTGKTNKRVVLFSHVFLGEARIGAGDMEVVSSTQVPAQVLKDCKIEYAFLGDIHKAQRILPNYFYSGSIERIDFGEREDIKGYIEFDVIKEHVEFHGLNSRRLEQITIDLVNPGFIKNGGDQKDQSDDMQVERMTSAIDIEEYVIQLLNAKKDELRDSIVKIKVVCTREQKSQVDVCEKNIISHLLDNINAYRIKGVSFEIVDNVSVRNADMNESLDPSRALNIWVGMQDYKEDMAQRILLAGNQVIKGHE